MTTAAALAFSGLSTILEAAAFLLSREATKCCCSSRCSFVLRAATNCTFRSAFEGRPFIGGAVLYPYPPLTLLVPAVSSGRSSHAT
jgi:hypothetical protein